MFTRHLLDRLSGMFVFVLVYMIQIDSEELLEKERKHAS